MGKYQYYPAQISLALTLQGQTMLILSLPQAHQSDLMRSMIEHPSVGAVRYNTGMSSAYDAYETLARIMRLSEPAKKPLYVDLKAKQLRVIEWANLPEGPIILNHDIKVSLPAKVYFRGDDCCNLMEVARGRELYVDPLPKAPVGRGQSVNIIAEKLDIEGGLIDADHEYLKAALDLGIRRFMLSFVERRDDVNELEEAIVRHGRGTVDIEECEIVFKIESKGGVEFVRSLEPRHFQSGSPYRLMAARDDLHIQIGVLAMPEALALIANKDPRAMCASRLLMGLERGEVATADISDLEYMRTLGYSCFMLSDGLSRQYSKEALQFWQQYERLRPIEWLQKLQGEPRFALS